jgi:hypothetical protein
MFRLAVFFLAVCGVAIGAARADEGMWLPNGLPSDKIEAAYGFKPDAAWLAHARLSAVRLASGCSAGLVSASGLVATNHHCVRECLTQLSSKNADASATGFYAATLADEKRCSTIEANRLIDTVEVTDRIRKATDGKEGAAFAAALKAEQAAITQACAGGDDRLRCDVVTLYSGGRYDLYKYRRYQDVRLVFAPEDGIADFGGDPDNFEFPRYALDVGFLRLYDNGKPLDSTDGYFKFSDREPTPGELVFTVGNPGNTNRLHTVAQLEDEREFDLPRLAFYFAELRGVLREFVRRGPEEQRVGGANLLGVENSLKVFKGLWGALSDPALIDAKRTAEAALQAKVAADPALHEAGTAWDDIAAAVKRHRAISDRAFLMNQMRRASRLLDDALIVVRQPVEQAKPDGERLSEYSAASFPALRQRLLSEAPISPALETVTLGFWLRKLQEILGPDDPLVHKILGAHSPDDLAASLVKASKLADPALRRRLLDGGQKAIDASGDPMVAFAKLVDPDSRAIRKTVEDDYDAVLDAAGGRIARASFAIYGAGLSPDATFTLRLSYGAVQGWAENGREVPPLTRIGGVFGRATGSDPFRLPPRWVAAKDTLDLGTVFDFASTNDIVGGNSGSPVIDRNGAVLGLAFDGNIHSLGGDYGYDPALNRSVTVSSVAIREVLAKIYGANRLLDELGTTPR